MIEISSLCAGYDKKDILENTSLICKSGQVTTIIGPNGCGKSTLLKTILGMLSVRKGEIKIDGVPLEELSLNMRARKIAYLSQGKNIPDITVERMVLHGRFSYLSYPRRYRKVDCEEAQRAMEKMGICEYAEKTLSELSGGLRQKVYIAMALCQGADILMLDEPATYLDISQQIKISKMCRELADEGKTVIVVSHDIASALKNSDIIAVMDKGKIVKSAEPSEIIKSGVIYDVFGVKVLSCETETGREYYYRKEEEK